MEFLKSIYEIFTPLMSPQNIGGFWAVITAIVALIGIGIKNYFEDKRKVKERQKLLIKEAHLEGIQYLSYVYNQILKLGSNYDIEINEEYVSYTAKFYNLFLVASPNVISQISEVSISFSKIALNLSEEKLEIKNVEHQIKANKEQRDAALKEMENINDIIDENSNKNIDSPEFYQSYQAAYNDIKTDYDRLLEEFGFLNNKRLELALALMKKAISSVIELAPLVYEAILEMRKDLERELKVEEKIEIKKTAEYMIKTMKEDYEVYMADLDNKIKALEEQEA